MNKIDTLPRWDVSVIYPSLESAEFEAGFADLITEIDEMILLFDDFDVSQQETPLVNIEITRNVETILQKMGDLDESIGVLYGYIHSFVSTDSRNELAQAKRSDLQRQLQRLSVLEIRLSAWLGSLDVNALIENSALAAEHGYMLQRAVIEAKHQMPPEKEELASNLTLSGGSAWAKLHSTYSSQLTVELETDGIIEHLPMSATRNLAYSPDRQARERAYHGELAAWEAAAVPFAACLNGVKGEVDLLSKERKWPSPLDAALFDNGIDRTILDAMMEAAHESFPDFRRYLRAKAKMLGLEKLAWYDLFAPVVTDGQTWEYETATDFILEQFTQYSPRMGELARRAFDENWIDAGPRPGKVDGAFCMRLQAEESRILSNFKPSYAGLNTLAHELGHAYHGYVIVEKKPLLRNYPMTLAETASIFCETIVKRAAINVVDANEQINILEMSLMGSCQVVVDITSRFLFEQSIFAKRAERELSISEFNELMLDAQRQTYGDGLDDNALHPYMWGVKSHYYSVGRSYYNYPYMFGLLFGLGLYARYQDAPDTFRANYDDLLASTGQTSAANLAQRFGFDISTTDFWRSSLDVIRADIDRFEALANGNS